MRQQVLYLRNLYLEVEGAALCRLLGCLLVILVLLVALVLPVFLALLVPLVPPVSLAILVVLVPLVPLVLPVHASALLAYRCLVNLESPDNPAVLDSAVLLDNLVRLLMPRVQLDVLVHLLVPLLPEPKLELLGSPACTLVPLQRSARVNREFLGNPVQILVLLPHQDRASQEFLGIPVPPVSRVVRAVVSPLAALLHHSELALSPLFQLRQA